MSGERGSAVWRMIGTVVLGVLVGLFIFVFVVLPYESGRAVCQGMCLVHLKSLRLSLWLYAEANEGVLPSMIRSWDVVGSAEELQCDCVSREHPDDASRELPPVPDFEYTAAGLDLEELPPDFPVAFDREGNHYDDTRNVLFAEGTVDLFSEQEFQALLRQGMAEYDRESVLARRLRPYLRPQ